jgi:hypothetical protein
MGNRISDWLEAEPLPRELHARVMGDRRLAAPGGGALRARVAFATAAVVVLLVGGGLGSILLRGTRPAGVTAVGASSPSPSTAAAATPSPSPSYTAPVVAPSPSPEDAQCHTADLTVTMGTSSGAAGTRYVPFHAKNAGTHTCTVSGYFGLALLDASGQQVGGTPRRDPFLPGSTPPAGPVSLVPGASAMFTFHWSDVQSSSQPCPTASRVELTAPNQYDHVFIPALTADGTKIAPCQPGGSGLTPVSVS